MNFKNEIMSVTQMRSELFWDLTQRKIPKERRSHLHHGGSLKSRIAKVSVRINV
jgi:hypothetical protein